MKAPYASLSALPAMGGIAVGILACVTMASAGVSQCKVLAISAFLLLLGGWLLWKSLHWIALWFVFAALGTGTTWFRMPHTLAHEILDTQGVLSGRIESVKYTEYSTRIVLKSCRFVSDGAEKIYNLDNSGVLLTVFGDELTLSPGDILSVNGKLSAQSNSPQSDFPHAPDFSSFARSLGVSAFMAVPSEDITITGNNPSVWQRISNSGNRILKKYLWDCKFDDRTTAFALAVVAGDANLMPTDLRDSFSTAGVAHILALSGLHVGILAMIATALLSGLRVLPGGRFIFHCSLCIVIMLYALVTGMSPSVSRAAVMLCIYSLAKYMQRSPSPYNTLSATIFVWLVINPMWLWSAGFQLSCVALLGIFWFENNLTPNPKKHPLMSPVVALIVTPVAAMCCTSVFALFYFHILPVWFLPANIVVTFILPLIIVSMALAAFLVACGLPAMYLSHLTSALYGFLENTVIFFAKLPPGSITGLYFSDVQLMFIVLVVLSLGWLVHRRRLLQAVCLCCSIVLLVSSITFAAPTPETEIVIPHTPGETAVYIRHHNKISVISDSAKPDSVYAANLTHHWAAANHVTEISFLTHNTSTFPVVFNDNLLKIHSVSVYCAGFKPGEEVPDVIPRADYLLLGGWFRDDPYALAKNTGAQTVIIGSSMHHTIADKISEQLAGHHLKIINARRTPVTINSVSLQ